MALETPETGSGSSKELDFIAFLRKVGRWNREAVVVSPQRPSGEYWAEVDKNERKGTAYAESTGLAHVSFHF